MSFGLTKPCARERRATQMSAACLVAAVAAAAAATET